MNNEIRLVSKINKDSYTDYVQEAFDLKVEDVAEVSIPNKLHLERLKDWQIGVICGASGSGKSTILRSIGSVSKATFDESRSVISNFAPMSPKEASILLSAMGLASVPTWIRPFSSLSNGEKYRAEVAKVVAEAEGDIILVDEYTSVVDRNVAKSMSHALQKYIRRTDKRIILATCHYDILEWLQPDWMYDLNKGGALEKGESLRLGRPQIQLQMYRTEYDTWHLFKKHHYMTADMNTSCACYVFMWNNQIVAFASVIPMPNGRVANAVRGSRTVVLPDFQGMGIGSRITDFLAGVYKASGFRYYTKTVNPRLGEYRNVSPRWKATAHNGKDRSNEMLDLKGFHYLARPSYCHEYVGEPIYGCEDIIKSIERLRYDKSMEGQLSLF